MKLRLYFTVIFVAITCCAFAIYANGQQPDPKPVVKPSLEQLSDMELLKLENLQLKFNALREQEQAIQNQYSELVKHIQAKHPGYVLNPQTNTLMPAPKPAEAKK